MQGRVLFSAELFPDRRLRGRCTHARRVKRSTVRSGED